jgi:hypothetical protein
MHFEVTPLCPLALQYLVKVPFFLGSSLIAILISSRAKPPAGAGSASYFLARHLPAARHLALLLHAAQGLNAFAIGFLAVFFLVIAMILLL